MRVTALNCGSGRPLGCRLLRVMPREMICRCLLVETGRELLLVDTGLGLADVHEPRRRLGSVRLSLGLRLRKEETAHAQICGLGLDPGDVRHIVLTHLDLDHVGGLSDFPSARVHVFGVEAQAARRRATIGERFRYRPAQLTDQSRWTVYGDAQVDSWHGFASTSVNASPSLSLRFVYLPGHTRGHCGVAIRTGRSWLLHAGDSYYSHLELDPANDSLLLGAFRRALHVHPATAAKTLEALRELRARSSGEVAMFCSHDPREIIRGVGNGGTE